jgi:ADP-ribose pyrophosphatase YjhB (NUDIX family)
MNSKIFCNNCGNYGHNFKDCIEPITSIGIIAYTRINNNIKYLMIRRRDTLGFVDFIRGKYNINNKQYLLNIINEMTISEKLKISKLNFDELWNELWDENISVKYMNEKSISKNKFNILKKGIINNEECYNLQDLINESNTNWSEQEWGFPKGRRNYKENDIDAGLREFKEETGIEEINIKIIKNIEPFEEIFIGSNYKSYKHKYYLAEISECKEFNDYEKSEVSKVKLYTFEEGLYVIRDYNLEKKKILKQVDEILNNYKIININ